MTVRQRTILLAYLAFGEDLSSGLGDEDGVLELCGHAAVRRQRRPPVVPHVALDAVAPHRQDRLCNAHIYTYIVRHSNSVEPED